MHADAAIVMHVRAGKVTRLVGYNDRENAFTDLAEVARRNPAERPH